ncbi:YdeI/OmpD-associated family protein [Lysobacter sp. TAB13]|uniref:YdeI/OmpD-associated family protein n=1 Tax=Lysobacter sp. TAB13 TaxID=3233065 RepID=UPI003F9AB232
MAQRKSGLTGAAKAASTKAASTKTTTKKSVAKKSATKTAPPKQAAAAKKPANAASKKDHAAKAKMKTAPPTLHDPRIDTYIAASAAFAQPILEHVRALVHKACPQVEESIKWGMPSFVYRGKILCGMAAFKQHATLGFWQAPNIADADRSRSGEAMGQFGRLTAVGDLPGQRELSQLVKQAMALIEAGVTRSPGKTARAKPPLAVPDDLAAALKRNAKARATYEGFPPSQQREYVEWIEEAKRDETRKSRLAQAMEWMAEGKMRNWKYMAK